MNCNLTHAALPDEFSVYTDEMNRQGEADLEINVNATPKGVKVPAYAGEILADRGLRITPEIAYGIRDDLEAGVYLPTASAAGGNFYLPGVRVKLKWMPVKREYFFGVNFEASAISRRFQPDDSLEWRLIAGARTGRWLLALNPTFSWAVHALRNSPDFSLAAKVSREVSAKTALGVEYYSDFGAYSSMLAANQRPSTLFAVADHDWKSLSLNFGVGYGLNAASDKWTLKASLSHQF